ncbi:hypothetical protein DLJ96_01180, partial [Actinotalea fermentans ATCC 43279 = JCM 9966 = DSM 3133]
LGQVTGAPAAPPAPAPAPAAVPTVTGSHTLPRPVVPIASEPDDVPVTFGGGAATVSAGYAPIPTFSVVPTEENVNAEQPAAERSAQV